MCFIVFILYTILFVCYRNTCNVKNLHEGFNISFKSFLKIKKKVLIQLY